MHLKTVIRAVPILGSMALELARRIRRADFKNSADYWERRYQSGANSGAGSYNRLAKFKAAFLNNFVEQHGIRSVLEFGSGDGAQLALAEYPLYVGVDVSPTVIAAARNRFSNDISKTFYLMSEMPTGARADLTMSLDVIYHLVEDEAFEHHMRSLFNCSLRYVIIYSSDHDEQVSAPHVRHRKFSRWVRECQPDFVLAHHEPNAFPFSKDDADNTSFADFYVFERSQPL